MGDGGIGNSVWLGLVKVVERVDDGVAVGGFPLVFLLFILILFIAPFMDIPLGTFINFLLTLLLLHPTTTIHFHPIPYNKVATRTPFPHLRMHHSITSYLWLAVGSACVGLGSFINVLYRLLVWNRLIENGLMRGGLRDFFSLGWIYENWRVRCSLIVVLIFSLWFELLVLNV